VRFEPQTIRIAAVIPRARQCFPAKVTFFFVLRLPQDQIIDCWRNSSSRSIAARISPVKPLAQQM